MRTAAATLILLAGLSTGGVRAQKPVGPEVTPVTDVTDVTDVADVAGVTGVADVTGVTDVTDEQRKNITPFSQVVGRNWTRWAGDQPSVTKINLIARIASPDFKGEDAAALVAMEKVLRKVDSIDRAGAMAIQDPKILKLYEGNVLKLQGAKRVLFANGKPTFTLLQQGPPGDCYFFSGTGWMALYRPEVIVKAITPLPGDRYRVRFPNGDEAEVTSPTDAELAINDSVSTLQDGLWMSILEKATGTIMSRTNAKGAAIPDPTVSIDRPGVPIRSIVERWTGRTPKNVPLGTRAKPRQVREALVLMEKRRLLAEALLLHKPAAKLPYDHVYAVLGFDGENDRVKLWNPWGTDFVPKGPSGRENGYARDKGVFYLSLDEFIEFYTDMSVAAPTAR